MSDNMQDVIDGLMAPINELARRIKADGAAEALAEIPLCQIAELADRLSQLAADDQPGRALTRKEFARQCTVCYLAKRLQAVVRERENLQARRRDGRTGLRRARRRKG